MFIEGVFLCFFFKGRERTRAFWIVAIYLLTSWTSFSTRSKPLAETTCYSKIRTDQSLRASAFRWGINARINLNRYTQKGGMGWDRGIGNQIETVARELSYLSILISQRAEENLPALGFCWGRPGGLRRRARPGDLPWWMIGSIRPDVGIPIRFFFLSLGTQETTSVPIFTIMGGLLAHGRCLRCAWVLFAA